MLQSNPLDLHTHNTYLKYKTLHRQIAFFNNCTLSKKRFISCMVIVFSKSKELRQHAYNED
jgi:hypothetical protein